MTDADATFNKDNYSQDAPTNGTVDRGAASENISEIILEVLSTNTSVVDHLGDNPGSWQIKPRLTASMSSTYEVIGSAGRVLVKCAHEHVVIGRHVVVVPPLRISYEADAARIHHSASPANLAPLATEPRFGLLALDPLPVGRCLQHRFMTREIIPGALSEAAAAIVTSSFRASDLANDFERHRGRVAHFAGNAALTQLSMELMFDGPFVEHPTNSWTSPQLDDAVKDLLSDSTLVLALQRLRRDYATRTETLLHNNLHLGQIYFTDTEDTGRVTINSSDFVGFGPIEFDYATTIASFFLNVFAQDGLGPGAWKYQNWMVGEWELAASTAQEVFSDLWRTERLGTSYSTQALSRFADADEMALAEFLTRHNEPLVGFVGIEMIRRIVGMARSIEMLQIPDPDRRADCERRALHFARSLVLHRGSYMGSPDMISALEDALRQER